MLHRTLAPWSVGLPGDAGQELGGPPSHRAFHYLTALRLRESGGSHSALIRVLESSHLGAQAPELGSCETCLVRGRFRQAELVAQPAKDETVPSSP